MADPTPAMPGEDQALKDLQKTLDRETVLKNLAVTLKDRATAEADLAKTRFGEITPAPFSGSADLGTGAGTAEAMLLGARAVRQIARRFARRIRKSAAYRHFLLASSVPDLSPLLVFETTYQSLRTAVLGTAPPTQPALGLASEVLEQTKTARLLETAAPVAAVGLGLGALQAALSYFKTDYKFVGIDISATDAMLIAAVAECLKSGEHGANHRVRVLSAYLPDSGSSRIDNELRKIHELQITARVEAEHFHGEQIQIQKSLLTAAEEEKASLQLDLEEAKNHLETWQALADAIGAWLKQLTATDDKGNSPLASIVRLAAIRDQLTEGTMLVLLQLHKVSGTGYTVKNLWSSLGRNPFFVMGGAVASLLGMDAVSGDVVVAMLLPWHGGYHSVSELPAVVNAEQEP